MPVTAVVLAAGESRRMGAPKLLLPWQHTTVLGKTLENARQSMAADTLVVTGHAADGVAAVAREHDVPTVHNPHYAEGEMLSSLQTGLRHLPARCDGVLVMLADQPMVTTAIINQLIEAFESGLGQIIAPTYDGQRGNPVLFGGPYFAELLALPWGEAPRAVLKRHPDALYLVAVDSPAVLLDLDRPEHYERMRPLASGADELGETEDVP